MGKSRSSRRANRRRHDPIHPQTTASSRAETENRRLKSESNGDSALFLDVDNVVGQLSPQSTPSDHLTALAHISVTASQKPHLTSLKNPALLKSVASHLTNPTTQSAAACALRNLSSLDPELCGALVAEDVVEKVVEVVRTLSPTTDTKNSEQTLIQCVALLWNLCESSPTAVRIATQANLHTSLAPFLDWTKFGLCLSVTVAHCLYTLTEDNRALTSISSSLPSTLHALLSSPSTTPPQLSTPALGTLLNTCDNNFEQLPSSIQDSFFQIITTALAQTPNHVDLMNQLSSDLPIAAADFNHAHEVKSEEINNLITMTKTAMEILSNYFVADSDPDADADSDSDSNADCDTMMDVDTDQPSNSTPHQQQQLTALLPLLLTTTTRSIPVNVHALLSTHKLHRLLNNHAQLVITGLYSLQHLFDSVSSLTVSLSEAEALLKLLQQTHNNQTELLVAATAAIRSLFSMWNRQHHHPLIPLAIFFDLYKNTSLNRVRINIVKILGSLSSNNLGLLKECSTFMKGILLGDGLSGDNLMLVVEVVDSLMDMFAEDESDAVWVEVGLGTRLKGLVGEIRRVSKKSKHSMNKAEWEEGKAVVETVLDNLPRFLEYKAGKRG